MHTMPCDSALDLIFKMLDEELSSAEQEKLDAHLSRCPYCQRERENYQGQHAQLEKTFAVDPVTVAEFNQQMRSLILGTAKARESRASLLVVDDQAPLLKMLALQLLTLAPEFDVLQADSVESAQTMFGQYRIDMILADLRFGEENVGVQLLEWVKENHPRTIRLLMTGYDDDVKEAVEAINRGKIYHYLRKDVSRRGWIEEWVVMLRKAAEKFWLERRQEHLLDELRQLNLELEHRVLLRTNALEAANQELRHKNKLLTGLALTDPLTSLPNRRAIVQLAEQELRRRNRYPSPLGVGIIDIDHFKEINTRLLHDGGDKVLSEMARCLQTSLRTVDLVGRIGGEEFLVIAPETDQDGVARLGERIRGVVEQHSFAYKEKAVKVTVSLGFVVVDSAVPADFQALKIAAESALREAKEKGRNRLELRRFPFAA
jgi:diguanylate cyclase